MEVSQNALAWMLCCSLLCGLALGLCYDAFRLTRMFIGIELPPSALLLRQRLSLPQRLHLLPSRSVRSAEQGKHKTALRYTILLIEDILFGLLCAVTLAVLLYQTNDGQFRLSAVVVLLCGIGVYLLTVGRLTRLFSGMIVVAMRAAVVWCVAIIAFPIACLVRLLARWTAPLRSRLKESARKRWRAEQQKIQQRKQARLARRTNKERSDAPTVRPPNGRHYFASGRNKQGTTSEN